MAYRAQPINPWPGAVSAALVLFLSFGTVGAVIWRAEVWSGLGPADWATIRFTIVQALLSAVISCALAVPIARALMRRNFPGRAALITLLGAPFILPVIVAVFGLLAVFGRNGVLNATLGWFGLPTIGIYGFHGVVLAHVFFNLPLATRMILQAWLAIPSERFRLAASLGFSPKDMRRSLEYPMLKATLPGALLVIFLICTTSFAVALTLGGGPKATTVELAIYQAFRFEFDLGKAALLAIVQFGIGLIGALIAFRVALPTGFGAGLDRHRYIWGIGSPTLRWIDGTWITVGALFLLTPLAMIVLRGLPGLTDIPPQISWAAGRSILVALAATGLTILMALPLALLICSTRKARWVEAAVYLSIAASPLVIGTGLFILIRPIANPIAIALPLTAVVNAFMALPFALRALVPAVRSVLSDYSRLAASLNLTSWALLRIVILPRLRRPLGFAAGLAAALSMGDLGVVTLFADPNHATLPMQMFRLMSSYRMQDAASAGLILLVLSLGLFWAFDKGGRTDADT